MNRRAFLATTVAFAGITQRESRAASDGVCPISARNDELWVLSSRGFGCQEPSERNRGLWQVRRRETASGWRGSTWDDFTNSAGDSLPTVIYVHGNRNDWDWALRNGQTVYQSLVRNLPAEQRFRFVIYAWPSDQIHGPVKDARYKANVANQEAFRFGWMAGRIAPATQLGLIGFSLGGRIITGGLHLLAGGTWQGHTLPPAERPSTRAVLWAPAVHDHWLLPNSAQGLALRSLERLRLYYNSCDPVLRRYHKAEHFANPAALGYSGCAAFSHLAETAGKVVQSDACGQVGKTHEMAAYCQSECIMRETRDYVLWQN